MTFRAWQQQGPTEAARQVTERLQASLSARQQRAVVAALADSSSLAAELAGAPADAPLRGVPFFAKDLFPVAGEPMLAGSTFLPEVRPTPSHDSALVARLRAAGAAYAGRTHLHEFAYGITGENPHYGDCEHPRFPGRTTGGSSSGSAAAVAAGIVPLALASDTGGSVRVPAAFCGLYGFRLTPRDPWVADAFPLAPSFDTAGWFTAHAEDMSATLAAVIGPSRPGAGTFSGGYLELPGLDPEVASACAAAAGQFAPALAGPIRERLLTSFALSNDAYNTVVADEAWDVHRSWAEKFSARYDPGVWQRLNRVHQLTGAQRAHARQSIAAIRDAWQAYFQIHDFLLLPATPCAALTKAECTPANRSRLLAVTTPVSVGGWPVLSLPVSLPSGLSTGLQLVVRTVDSPVVAWALERCRSH